MPELTQGCTEGNGYCNGFIQSQLVDCVGCGAPFSANLIMSPASCSVTTPRFDSSWSDSSAIAHVGPSAVFNYAGALCMTLWPPILLIWYPVHVAACLKTDNSLGVHKVVQGPALTAVVPQVVAWVVQWPWQQQWWLKWWRGQGCGSQRWPLRMSR